MVWFCTRQRRRHHRTGFTLICYRPYTLYIGTHSGTDTTCPSCFFFFWQAIIFRAKFSATGDCTAFFSCPALLFAGKGNKYGTGKKRMQWSSFHQQRQAVFRHRLSQRIGRIWNPQPLFQGLYCPQGNLPHQTARKSKGNVLCVRGIYGLSFISYFEIGKLPEISRTGQTRLYGIELRIECKQGSLSFG